MATKAWRVKQQRTPKFRVRKYNRCAITGRRRAYMRRFGISRIQFREMASWGELPGVTKASW
ncbi:type Z 30S ribosomal protein S14 [Candidatus Methylacidithermus pantelleriae]|uniref:Small ribosomal subunit protein uS14 n=1 Tax=Candidatus Methylacidithermus pantelleriae TaxID=2744239 RepID=A0A8J2BTY0_9BACT|nr:type Z 30S ribosomal protein S14 [Candidatus Methylacidithermus pantelleriae]CAF0698874.1 30S ribosomal protein S14 type Z [Candidatus Methylacidithermus pantelleriae]